MAVFFLEVNNIELLKSRFLKSHIWRQFPPTITLKIRFVPNCFNSWDAVQGKKWQLLAQNFFSSILAELLAPLDHKLNSDYRNQGLKGTGLPGLEIT